MPKDLNSIYCFKIGKPVKYDASINKILKANPIKHHDDWTKSCFQPIKEAIKGKYYWQQNRRCAYCRKKLNAVGYFNHIDHIIPKSHHKRWMFTPKNLAITCEICNPLKNDDDTLKKGHKKNKFPNSISGFTVFNPHFNKWGDCFEVEDGMFLRGKNKRGEETIKVCKLHQYHFAVQFTEESEVNPKTAIRRATTRVRSFPNGTVEHEAARKLIEFYSNLI